MPEPISRLQRWLDLIARLAGRHFPVPVEEHLDALSEALLRRKEVAFRYGPEAEVLDPAEARGWVRGAVECWRGLP